MHSPRPEDLHDLNAFAGFLRLLAEEGIPFAVIGGCAVGAYARLRGEEVLSRDLDLYMTGDAQDELLRRADALHAKVVKWPAPRTLRVAVLEWNGLEVNALISSASLPEPETVLDRSREFTLRRGGRLQVPIADPFDLLANKIAVRREKDRPHIEILRRFVEEEVVDAFAAKDNPRRRLAPARRYLDILALDLLPIQLARRLAPLADKPALRRFLASEAPHPEVLRVVLAAAALDDERAALRAIVDARRKM